MGRVKFASPTPKNSLKLTCPTAGRTQNCRREVYFTGLSSGKFCVTWAGIRVWRSIENEADQFKMAAVERRGRGLALLMMFETGFLDLEEDYCPQEEEEVRVG